MLGSLRNRSGKPAVVVRVLAVLVLLGMLAIVAPGLMPAIRWAVGLL